MKKIWITLFTLLSVTIILGSQFVYPVVAVSETENTNEVIMDGIVSSIPMDVSNEKAAEINSLAEDSSFKKEIDAIQKVDPSASVSTSNYHVAKNDNNQYFISYKVIGNQIMDESTAFMAFDSKGKLVSSGTSFAVLNDGNQINGYLYENGIKKIETIGDNQTNIFKTYTFDQDGIKTEFVNPLESSGGLKGYDCLYNCVVKILGAWGTTILLASCIAACATGVGCIACGAILASAGVGYCWAQCN